MTAPNDDQPAWSQEKITGLSRGFMESRVLLTAAELDLFTLTATAPLTAGQIAAAIGAELRGLTILLDALAAMGLMVKRDDAYRAEPSAGRLLAAAGPDSILPIILHNVDLWERWGALTAKIAAPRRPGGWTAAFIGAMHAIASPLAGRIVRLADPAGSRRMLDVGGGSGVYTLAFLEAAPALRATIFDRPEVLEMARQRVAEAGMEERVTFAQGDFEKDPLPAGHDLAFVSAIIHQNAPAENVALFRNVFASLDPGGRVVVRDHVLSPDRTAPRGGALFAVNMLVGTAGGNSYTEAEIGAALTEAGFVGVRLIHPDERMDGLVEAFRPRQGT
ncbi:MAG: methyltransferase [Syntrophales bacterium]